MTSYAVVLLLLTGNLVHGKFSSDPPYFRPTITESLNLRCEPMKQSVFLLAIQIRKTASVDSQENPTENNENKESGKEAQSGTENVKDQKENQGKAQDLSDLPSLNDNFENVKFKRSAIAEFKYATITTGNNKMIQPENSRFSVDGNVTDKKPFLVVKIERPIQSDAGSYNCLYTFLDEQKRVLSNNENWQLEIEMGASTRDLEKRISKLENSISVFSEVAKQELRLNMQADTKDNFVQEDIVLIKKQIQNLQDLASYLGEQIAHNTAKMNILDKAIGSQGGSKNNNANNAKAENEHAFQSEELNEVRRKLEHMETTQIQALAGSIKTLKNVVTDTQNRVSVLELKVNGELNVKVQDLMNVNRDDIEETMEKLQVELIPAIIKNVTDCQRSIAELQRQRSQDRGEAEVVSAVATEQQLALSTAAITEKPPISFAGFACYVCGRNETQEPCNLDTNKNAMQCPYQQSYCATVVYQDGHRRHVYKYCARDSVCQSDKSKTQPACADETFIDAKVIECHFCCKSTLCNEGLRPNKDMY